MKKLLVHKLIIVWFICFVALVILVNGMGIFGFEKKTSDITNFIDGTEITKVQGGGYNLGRSCLLDFSESNIDEAVYGVELTLANSVNLENITAYLEENTTEATGGNWQNVTIEQKRDKLIIMFTKSYSRLKICADQPLDIASFVIITKSDMVLMYFILGVIALGISVLYVLLISDKFETLKPSQFLLFLKNRKVMLTFVIIVIECMFICLAEVIGYLCVRGVHFNPCRILMVGCMAAFITILLRHKESVVKRFHIFYLFLVIATGTIYIIGCAPYSLDLSWDDQTHYARTNYLARGFRSYETESGYQLKNHYFDRGNNEDNFTKGKRMELMGYISSLDKNKNYGGLRYVKFDYSISAAVSYLPAAIGLIIGRGLGMPTMMSLLLGRWANLLCYSLIFSYSIWLLRNRGYIIAAFIGMIPTSVYIASNYSYDWWVTSLSVLGFALFESEIRNKESIHYCSILKVMIVMFLAFIPKAVYLTMIIPIIAVVAAKGKKGKKGVLLVAATMFMLLASFMVPLVVSGGTANTDTRGGTDVNSLGQIQFILANPIQYLMILARFLWRYINPDNFVETFGYYILFGTGKYYSVVLILLVLGTFADNVNYGIGESKGAHMLRFQNAIGIIATLVLISTALYISFTPVGMNSINGVQPRYIIPLLFPFLYYICRVNVSLSRKIKDNLAVYGSMLMALILCFNIYVQCICFY